MSKVLELRVRSSDATSLVQLRDDLEAARSEIMAAWSTGIDARRKPGVKP